MTPVIPNGGGAARPEPLSPLGGSNNLEGSMDIIWLELSRFVVASKEIDDNTLIGVLLRCTRCRPFRAAVCWSLLERSLLRSEDDLMMLRFRIFQPFLLLLELEIGYKDNRKSFPVVASHEQTVLLPARA